MICKQCGNAGILNQVLGKEFYYCRTCKIEIALEDPYDDTRGNSMSYTTDDPWADPEVQKEYQEWLDYTYYIYTFPEQT